LLSAREYVAELSARSGVKIDAQARSSWSFWLSDLVKELAKNAIRHPNRRWPSPHDWRCRSHRAVYDSSDTSRVLDWKPVADRKTMVSAGIHKPADAAG